MNRLVVLDGANGCGKSTLRYALFQSLEYNVLTIDRFTPSQWVYDRLRGNDNSKEILEFEEKMNMLNPIVIICKCDPMTAIDRARPNDHLRTIEFSIEDQLLMFDKYFDVSRYSYLYEINTGMYNVDRCVDRIKYIMERVDERTHI